VCYFVCHKYNVRSTQYYSLCSSCCIIQGIVFSFNLIFIIDSTNDLSLNCVILQKHALLVICVGHKNSIITLKNISFVDVYIIRATRISYDALIVCTSNFGNISVSSHILT
jgi:hypothetical protein